MRQPQWTIFEAAILLEGYLEWKDNHMPKQRIVKNISCDLRQMAINAGAVIDDVYRNENGILSCPYFSDSFLIDYTENAM